MVQMFGNIAIGTRSDPGSPMRQIVFSTPRMPDTNAMQNGGCGNPALLYQWPEAKQQVQTVVRPEQPMAERQQLQIKCVG